MFIVNEEFDSHVRITHAGRKIMLILGVSVTGILTEQLSHSMLLKWVIKGLFYCKILYPVNEFQNHRMRPAIRKLRMPNPLVRLQDV